jgi:hypothetical protein
MTPEIDAAIVATERALVAVSRQAGHRAAMAKGQLSAALEVLRRAKEFADAPTSGLYSAIDPTYRKG